MIVGKSTSRKVYRIINITNHSNLNYQSYIRLHLDNDVEYKDGKYSRIDVNGYCYGYQVDRFVEIDNSKTRYESNGHEFYNDGSVVKLTDINAALIDRARAEYAKVQKQTYDLQNELAEKEKYIERGKGELILRENKIKSEQDKVKALETRLEEEKKEYKLNKEEYEKLRSVFFNLQIENSSKSQEIENQRGKAKKFEDESDEAKEKLLELKIKNKVKDLDDFVKECGIQRKKIRELEKLHRQLIRMIDEDYNRDTKDEIEDKIEDIKDELLEKDGITNDKFKEFNERCEKIAKLRVKHEKILSKQNQYQTQIEVLPKNN